MLRPPRQEDLGETWYFFHDDCWLVQFCHKIIYFNVYLYIIIIITNINIFLYLQVCACWADKYSEKLGGPGRIVGIAKISHHKYNRGRQVTGYLKDLSKNRKKFSLCQ